MPQQSGVTVGDQAILGRDHVAVRAFSRVSGHPARISYTRGVRGIGAEFSRKTTSTKQRESGKETTSSEVHLKVKLGRREFTLLLTGTGTYALVDSTQDEWNRELVRLAASASSGAPIAKASLTVRPDGGGESGIR